jgi:hypothetical protein
MAGESRLEPVFGILKHAVEESDRKAMLPEHSSSIQSPKRWIRLHFPDLLAVVK